MDSKELADYIAAFRRNKRMSMLIVGILLGLTLLLAKFWPPTYRSTAIILIEEQEVPQDLIRSTITSFANQRLQTISQQVMTRVNLLAIIEKYDLYKNKRDKMTREDLIAKMRDDIGLDTIKAEVVDSKTGRASEATIAFTLSFDGPDPALVQAVANEITTLYLEENLKTRAKKTAQASEFLQQEAGHLRSEVRELERRLAEFKQENLHRLPELKDLNTQFLDKTEREVLELDSQVRVLQDRKFYLDGQLAQIKPFGPMFSESGERILSPEDRLKVLRTEYVSMATKYSSKHPDVVKIRQEIKALEVETGQVNESLEQAKRLSGLRAELAIANKEYSSNHPDLQRIVRNIEALEKEISLTKGRGLSADVSVAQPENPAYITLKAQLDSVQHELSSSKIKRQALQQKIAGYEERLIQSPQIERNYISLVRDHENATEKYKEIKAKQMEAEIAEQLERKSKGERFSIIDPPPVPEKPIKPNRMVIMFLGMLFSFGCGFSYVALAELMDHSVRSPKTVVSVTGSLPLVVIPYLEIDRGDEKSRKNFNFIGLVVIGFVVVLILVVFEFIVTPADSMIQNTLDVINNH